MENLKNSSIDIDNMEKLYEISVVIIKVKNEPDIPKKFLGHLKKVGSYTSSLMAIVKCACMKEYKVP